MRYSAMVSSDIRYSLKKVIFFLVILMIFLFSGLFQLKSYADSVPSVYLCKDLSDLQNTIINLSNIELLIQSEGELVFSVYVVTEDNSYFWINYHFEEETGSYRPGTNMHISFDFIKSEWETQQLKITDDLQGTGKNFSCIKKISFYGAKFSFSEIKLSSPDPDNENNYSINFPSTGMVKDELLISQYGWTSNSQSESFTFNNQNEDFYYLSVGGVAPPPPSSSSSKKTSSSKSSTQASFALPVNTNYGINYAASGYSSPYSAYGMSPYNSFSYGPFGSGAGLPYLGAGWGMPPFSLGYSSPFFNPIYNNSYPGPGGSLGLLGNPLSSLLLGYLGAFQDYADAFTGYADILFAAPAPDVYVSYDPIVNVGPFTAIVSPTTTIGAVTPVPPTTITKIKGPWGGGGGLGGGGTDGGGWGAFP